MWLALAFSSAIFAALVSVLGKRGLSGVSSNLATAIRALVALVIALLVTFISGSTAQLITLTPNDLTFILLSGVATGASWLCFFRALQLGRVADVTAVDRTSLLFTGLAAIILFGETNHLPTKIAGLLVIVAGTLLLVAPSQAQDATRRSWVWLPWALASMAFAVATSLLAKVGLAEVDSSLATALRTGVVVVFAGLIVLFRGEGKSIREISRGELGFLLASGAATGASWLCYFGAIKLGEVSLVAPIDKLSIVFAAGMAAFLLGEKVTKRDAGALAVIVFGTLVLLY